MNIIPGNTKQSHHPQFGGKANNLFRLMELKLNVPAFVVISNDELQKLLSQVDINDPENVEQVIRSYQFSDSFKQDISDYFRDCRYFAVRSSAIDEDGSEKSFAGQFHTELYVPADQLDDAIKKVWLSAFSHRIYTYRRINHLSFQPGIAVIIQSMIDADVSGVAFGMNPVNGDHHEIVLNAVYGLGEGLVGGLLNADLFSIKDGQITASLADKNEKLIFDEITGNGTTVVQVDPEDAQQPALTNAQINEIVRTLKTLNSYFHKPQDIEFSFKDNILFLLQARPVTSAAKIFNNAGKNETGHEIIWDNSNIIESYPGVTSPLTFSFIIKMYEAVYRQLSGVLGISRNKIEEHKDVYANMLGLLKGRVYYNLNNWYISLSLLPGYSINASFMEKMMGVKEKFPVKIRQRKKTIRDYTEVITAIAGIMKNLVTIESQRKHFQARFDQVMMEYTQYDLNKATVYELMQYYLNFEQTLVKEWKAPLVNDFFAMIFFGLLQKQVQAAGFSDNDNLHNDLLCGSRDIITTQPIEITLRIAEMIRSDKNATHLFEENSPSFILNQLSLPEYAPVMGEINNYISYWGDRSVGELKLETITYHQDPASYIRVIKSYVQKGVTHGNYFTSAPDELRKTAERKVYQKIKNPIKKLLFRWILKKARYFVSNRENLRYQRTRGFGMVRKLFIAMGERLYEQQVISQPRDIFYLSKEEIFQLVGGTAITNNHKELVAIRKSEYELFQKTHLPERISTKGIPEQGLPVIEHENNLPLIGQTELKGIGCSAGKVKGKVRIVHHPDEAENLNGDILVTTSTDPGWVTLFPTCSAILVERGSLLSHSAIVSRELGIPCIVGIKDLLNQLVTGMEVEMDGSTGIIKILSDHPHEKK